MTYHCNHCGGQASEGVIDRKPPQTRWDRFLRAVAVSLRMRHEGYWQTWMVVNTLPSWLKRIVQVCCGWRGHEISDTEHGWDGGRRVDRWCRWCNALIRIPRAESTWVDEFSGMFE